MGVHAHRDGGCRDGRALLDRGREDGPAPAVHGRGPGPPLDPHPAGDGTSHHLGRQLRPCRQHPRGELEPRPDNGLTHGLRHEARRRGARDRHRRGEGWGLELGDLLRLLQQRLLHRQDRHLDGRPARDRDHRAHARAQPRPHVGADPRAPARLGGPTRPHHGPDPAEPRVGSWRCQRRGRCGLGPRVRRGRRAGAPERDDQRRRSTSRSRGHRSGRNDRSADDGSADDGSADDGEPPATLPGAGRPAENRGTALGDGTARVLPRERAPFGGDPARQHGPAHHGRVAPHGRARAVALGARHPARLRAGHPDARGRSRAEHGALEVPRRARASRQPAVAHGRRAPPRTPRGTARIEPRRARRPPRGWLSVSAQPGTIEVIALELASALEPLKDRLTPEAAPALLGELGLTLPGDFASAATSIGTVAVKAAALAPLVVSLVDAIDAEDHGQIAAASVPLLSAVVEVVDAITALGPAIEGAVAAAGGLTPAQRDFLEDQAELLPGRLLEWMLLEYLERKSEGVYTALVLLGIVGDVDDPGVEGDPVRPPFRRRGLFLDRFVTMLTAPEDFLRAAYGFGNPDFDGMELFVPLAAYLESLDVAVDIVTPPGGRPALEAYVIRLSTDAATNPPSLTADLRIPATQDEIGRAHV